MTLSLVTGGSGFIGQHLVQQLLADGHDVRILDVEPPARSYMGVDFIQGSITDADMVREAMQGVHHLYHTAAIPHLWLPDPRMFHETNVVGTSIVFEAAVRAHVERVVHTSSATVLIDKSSERRQTVVSENHQTRESDLIGPYARSKWNAENVALSYADRLPVVIVMPTLPLGPGDRHFTPPSRMLRDFINGKNVAYADCILNIIDVRDVALGHSLACLHGRSGQRYLLNSHSVPMAVFLECLERLTDHPMPKWRVPCSLALVASACMELWSNLVTGRSPIAPLAGLRAGLRPIVFESRRAQVELGLPTTPLDDTLKDAVAWLAGNGHLSDQRFPAEFAFDDR